MLKPLFFQNKIFTKKDIKNSISESFLVYGKTRTSRLINQMKNLGFFYATKSGISLGLEELKVPKLKKNIIKDSNLFLQYANFSFFSGFITASERFNLILGSWTNSTNFVTNQLIYFLQKLDPFNALNLMVFSGARGNISQVSQLIGIRGLISDSNGQILEIPIVHNFCEGLTLTDYFLSTYGARKGIVDTSLKTADAGYLTRRLIYAATDVMIRDLDCFTKYYLKIYKHNLKSQFLKKVIGFTIAETIYDIQTKSYIIYKNTIITEKIAIRLFFSSIKFVCVYSILTCSVEQSVCQKCYGWNLSYNNLVSLGSTVGINAAQAIGEPGTQLTMRTFHTGGSFTNNPSRQICSKYTGFITVFNISSLKIRLSDGRQIEKLLKPILVKLFTYKNFIWEFLLSFGFFIYFLNKSFILKNSVLAEIPLNLKQQPVKAFKNLITPYSGELLFFPNLNIIYLVKADVFSIPKFSLSNLFFSNIKKFKINFLFYNKVNTKINGMICSFSGSSLISNNFIFIKKFHIFLFPFFWDIIYKQLLFFTNLFTIYTIIKLPFIKNFFIFYFAQQLSFLYNLPRTSIIQDLTSGYSYFDYKLKKKIIFKNSSLISIPYTSFYFLSSKHLNPIKLNTYFKVHYDLMCTRGSQLCDGFIYLIKKTFKMFSFLIMPGQFYILSTLTKLQLNTYNQRVYFAGENFAELFVFQYLTKIRIRLQNTEYKVFFSPIIVINIPKIKHVNTFKSLSFLNLNNSFSLINVKKSSVISLITSTLWIKNFSLFIKFCKVDNYFYVVFYKFLLLTSFLKSFLKNALKVYFQFTFFEILLSHSTIGFLSSLFSSVFNIKKIKKTFISQPRILFITTSHYLTYYFELARFIKFRKVITLYNSCIIPYVNLLINGKLQILNSFSIIIHTGLPYYLTSNIQIFYRLQNFLLKDEVFGLIAFEQILTGDIINGLSKIEAFFELSRPNNSSMLTHMNGYIYFKAQQKNINTFYTRSFFFNSAFKNYVSFFTPKKQAVKNSNFTCFQYLPIGKTLTVGNKNFHNLLFLYFIYFLMFYNLYFSVYASFKRIQILLIKKIYYIYMIQNVSLSFKHISIIIKQLTLNIKIIWDFSNSFFIGEILTLHAILNITNVYVLFNSNFIYYKPFLMGVSQISAKSSSFLSAASFQEPVTILSNAAIEGRIDWLYGLQENIIIGRSFSMGSSF